MKFLSSLLVGFIIYSVFIYVLAIDWLSFLVALAFFLLLRHRLDFNGIGFWSGELLSLVAFDALAIYIAASIQLPLWVQDPTLALAELIPGLLASVAALVFFGLRKKSPKEEFPSISP